MAKIKKKEVHFEVNLLFLLYDCLTEHAQQYAGSDG